MQAGDRQEAKGSTYLPLGAILGEALKQGEELVFPYPSIVKLLQGITACDAKDRAKSSKRKDLNLEL